MLVNCFVNFFSPSEAFDITLNPKNIAENSRPLAHKHILDKGKVDFDWDENPRLVRMVNNVYNQYIPQAFVPARSDNYITPIIDSRAIHKLATNYNKGLGEYYEKLDNLLVQQKKLCVHITEVGINMMLSEKILYPNFFLNLNKEHLKIILNAVNYNLI